MVHLLDYNYKNCQAILRFKTKFANVIEGAPADIVSEGATRYNRAPDEFGELAAKRIIKSQKRFTPEEVAVLIEKYQSGMSTRELGMQFGCNRNTVSCVLKRNGIQVRGRGRQAQR